MGAPGMFMLMDSGAEVHIVCERDRVHLMNVKKLASPCILDTAGGEVPLDTVGSVVCAGIEMDECLYNPYAKL
eukprot:10683335-Heterocapsa_arctica.AAC.1